MNLQQAVFAGLTDPGNLVIVRELVSNPTVGDVDTAVFRGARAGYTLVGNPNGSVTISDAAAANLDGTDTLWNVERAQFTDQTVSLGATATPTPASLTFTARAIGSPSPIQTVTFRNTGIQQLIVSNVALTGADAGSYSITSNSSTSRGPPTRPAPLACGSPRWHRSARRPRRWRSSSTLPRRRWST